MRFLLYLFESNNQDSHNTWSTAVFFAEMRKWHQPVNQPRIFSFWESLYLSSPYPCSLLPYRWWTCCLPVDKETPYVVSSGRILPLDSFGGSGAQKYDPCHLGGLQEAYCLSTDCLRLEHLVRGEHIGMRLESLFLSRQRWGSLVACVSMLRLQGKYSVIDWQK